jgi:predicted component of type VI protein secretion system
MGIGMPAQLVALTGGPSILLDKPILLIGRHPECDIQIESRKVSRRHCCIAQVHDYLIIRDLGSTNGVRINGVRVVEGRIKPGDELTIGSIRYQVRLEGAPPPSEPVRRKPARKIAARLDDDDLESCDEPIPLSERPGTAPPVSAPSPLTPESPPDPDVNPQSPLPPHVLPERLELAPGSSAFPAAPSSHSPNPA